VTPPSLRRAIPAPTRRLSPPHENGERSFLPRFAPYSRQAGRAGREGGRKRKERKGTGKNGRAQTAEAARPRSGCGDRRPQRRASRRCGRGFCDGVRFSRARGRLLEPDSPPAHPAPGSVSRPVRLGPPEHRCVATAFAPRSTSERASVGRTGTHRCSALRCSSQSATASSPRACLSRCMYGLRRRVEFPKARQSAGPPAGHVEPVEPAEPIKPRFRRAGRKGAGRPLAGWIEIAPRRRVGRCAGCSLFRLVWPPQRNWPAFTGCSCAAQSCVRQKHPSPPTPRQRRTELDRAQHPSTWRTATCKASAPHPGAVARAARHI